MTVDLEQLAADAAGGDSEALAALIKEIQHPVYRLALRFLSHPADAEDAAQEILIRVMTQLSTFEGRSQFMTWVYTVATRMLLRTKKRAVESSVAGPERFARIIDEGLADRDYTAEEANYNLLCKEIRISCTYGMLLCLSRPLRPPTSWAMCLDYRIPTAPVSVRSVAPPTVNGSPGHDELCARSSTADAASSTLLTAAAAVARSRRPSPPVSSIRPGWRWPTILLSPTAKSSSEPPKNSTSLWPSAISTGPTASPRRQRSGLTSSGRSRR